MKKDGIEVYKYSTTEESLSHSGPNQCFCDEVDDNEYQCPVNGLVDLEPCFKAPVLMSNPHFYLGDEEILDYVQGLKPERHLHESFVLIEPVCFIV